MQEAAPRLFLAALGSFLLWSNLYLLLHALRREWTAEWTCRVVTSIHAAVMTTLGVLSILELGHWPFFYVGQPNTHFQAAIVAVTMGYFTFDFAWCLSMRTEGPVMLLHHGVSIFGFSYVLYSGKYGCEMVTVLAASEATNPLLQLRWFLKETGNYAGTLERIIDWTFVSLFCSIRIGVGSVFLIFFLFSPDVDWIALSGGSVFYLVSVVFGLQIISYIHHKYFKTKTMMTIS